MHTIEFDGFIQNGKVALPPHLFQLEQKNVHVVLLFDDENRETTAFANHAASCIHEWKNPDEDEVWT
jgi:hypothetical protein